MKVQLLKQIFSSNGYTTHGYKIKHIEYCCNNLSECPIFEFSTEEVDEDGVPSPSIREDVDDSEYGETYEYSNYYRIKFCPFCGKPIIVEVIGEEDVVELFNEIQAKRNEIHKKYMRTDSKKKEYQYGSMRNQLDNLLNYFYELCDYKTEDEIRNELLHIWFTFREVNSR